MIEIIRNICCILCLAQVSFEDVRTRRIPDRYVCGIILIWTASVPVLMGPEEALKAAVSALASATFVIIPAVLTEILLKKKTLGGGDIKLIFALALYLGFFKTMALVFAACVMMLVFMVLTHTDRAGACDIKEKVPFGPALAASGAAGLLTR